eukprot:symbB.v1.2.004778.t1/scaffold274.1/size244435/19
MSSPSSGPTSDSKSITANVWEVYDFVQPLGSGTFGVVREVKPKQGKQRFAVKTIPVAADIEMVLMLKLEHEHVVRLEHAILEAQEMHLIMELCSGGDLQAWIDALWVNDSAGKRQFGSPSTSQVATFSHQMLSAVAYIHHLSIAHRDIKPSNWLIRSKGSILPVLKLSDFGLASTFHPGELMSKICGSMIYMAPEVFWKSYTELCDIWSLGLVIQEIVCGKPLFGKLSKTAVEKNVCGSEINLDQMGWTCHGPWLKPWVQQMLVKESVGRPSALHALDHPQMHHAKQKSQGSCQCTVS